LEIVLKIGIKVWKLEIVLKIGIRVWNWKLEGGLDI
jgi:hypothetical protein